MSLSNENVSSCPPLVLRCPEANRQPSVCLVYETGSSLDAWHTVKLIPISVMTLERTPRSECHQQKLIFDARFRRCYRMVHFIACRVLGGSERAEEAIGSCWRIASRHPQRFEHEGEFRSWLLRVLIDESLVLLRESVPTPTPKVSCEPVPAQVFRSDDVRDGKSDIRTDDQDRFSQDFSMARE
jgi:hypothetical protein